MRALIAFLALMLSAAPAYAHNHMDGMAHSRDGQSMVDPKAQDVQIGGPFSLVNQAGKPFTDKDLLGKYSLIFFGFTFCPDICPTELQNITAALDLTDKDVADKTNVVFITVDPERDTPATIDEYLNQFGTNLIGLTGTKAQIAAVAHAYKVYYARSADSEPSDHESYMMEHSSFVYLMGPDGKYISVLPSDSTPQDIANALKAAMAKH